MGEGGIRGQGEEGEGGQWCDVAPKWAITYLGAEVNFSSLEKCSEFIYFLNRKEKEKKKKGQCKTGANFQHRHLFVSS